MDNQELLNKIYDKLDEINKDLTAMKITLASQHHSLEEHVRRTELNEQSIQKLQDHIDGSVKALQSQVQPVQDHVRILSGVMKFVGGAALIASLILSVLQAASLLSK